MNIGPWLDLTTVQVGRTTRTTDGMGGATTSTVMTTLSRAAIWQAGTGDQALSGKVAQQSTHVLALETGTYDWAATDTIVVYGSNTYAIKGHSDDVANQSVITVVGLERIT